MMSSLLDGGLGFARRVRRPALIEGGKRIALEGGPALNTTAASFAGRMHSLWTFHEAASR